MLTSEMVKKLALKCGADAAGIASLDRFEGAPPEMDPRNIYPAAKSMIGLIFRIPRGVLRGVEEGTNFFQYPSMGYGGINEVYAPTVLYELGRFIEASGYEAAVYRNTGGRGSVSDMTGVPAREESPELHGEEKNRQISKRSMIANPVSPDKTAPDVCLHFRIAAYLCGLGEIGFSKMLLTPMFGPFNRQAFILTDAELEPDELIEPGTLCNRCMVCVTACPGKCLPRDKTVKVNLAGKEIEWSAIDEWKCFAYYIGANPQSNPFVPPDIYDDDPELVALMCGDEKITNENYAKLAHRINSAYPTEIGGYNPPKCGGCLRACYNTLEKRGVLERQFENKFRQRPVWKIQHEEKTQD